MGYHCYLDGASVFTVGAGVGVGVGRIGQSFLISNRFPDADPVVGPEVSCQTGALDMSSSGGGLELCMEGCPSFWDLAEGCGTSANCPLADLYTITSIDDAADFVTGVWVEAVATIGVGAVEVEVEGVDWVSASPCTFFWQALFFFFYHLPWVLGPF